jgi:tight adherence protein B
MNLLTLGLFVFAVLLAVAAIWALRAGQRADVKARIQSRFQDFSAIRISEESPGGPLRGSVIDRWLWRGGIRLSPGRVASIAAGSLLAVAVAWARLGALGGLTLLGCLLLVGVLWPQVQYRRRSAAMVAQVPLFLDQMVRALATGRNLDGAMRVAAEETREPLAEVLARVQQAADLGEDAGDALRDAARLYELHELHFLAMAMQIARSYGSSPKEMLDSVAKLVHNREHARRELRAMTGETRFSAWVLGILPSAMAIYMAAVNPKYINTMWFDPTGRMVLLTALGLQGIGILILWRMVKSI